MMTRYYLLLFGLFFSFNVSAQQDQVAELVTQGVDLHDAGKFDEAVEKYKAALALDSRSSAANYELAYTYMAQGNYADAIRYSQVVIKQKDENLESAYIVYGSSLDLSGKPQEAIKAYETALKPFPNSYLLSYNLALTAFNVKDLATAEKSAIKAIKSNPRHPSSHLVLANTMITKGERVKSLLALYNFLVLEPSSGRSLQNYKLLRKWLNFGVTKSGENNINVQVPSFSQKDKEFDAAEMMLSLLSASKYSTNKEKTDFDQFKETTRSFFSLLSELKKDNKGFWWEFYVDKYKDIVDAQGEEAFAYYISQCTQAPEITSWLQNNQDKVAHLKELIANQ